MFRESVEVVVNEELKPGTLFLLFAGQDRLYGRRHVDLESSSKLFLVFRTGYKAVYIGSGKALFRLSPSIPHLKD